MTIQESNKLTIFLDFDGTVVEHQAPRIGRENFGCMPVIRKLQEAGHTIILNTYRADYSSEDLGKALRFINQHIDVELFPIEATERKIFPPPWDWEHILETNTMFIDDQAMGMPVKRAVMSNGWMVDWSVLDQQFEKNGLYNSQPSNTK